MGDPVVATYMEAVAFQVRKAGTAAPGGSVQETRVSSKPGETPAGAIGRELTMTATITALDKKARTVTLKGPLGNTETFKVRDPKNLEGVKVGDLVDITYTQALAVTLDKRADHGAEPAPLQPSSAALVASPLPSGRRLACVLDGVKVHRLLPRDPRTQDRSASPDWPTVATPALGSSRPSSR